MLRKVTLTSGTGMGTISPKPVHVPGASCAACLPDPAAALVPRIAAIVDRGTYSERWEGAGLRFYRQKAECDAAIHARP